jgi:hypothetical protein
MSVNIRENRLRPGKYHHICVGNKREARNDYLVTRPDAKGFQGQMERRGAVAARYAV